MAAPVGPWTAAPGWNKMDDTHKPLRAEARAAARALERPRAEDGVNGEAQEELRREHMAGAAADPSKQGALW